MVNRSNCPGDRPPGYYTGEGKPGEGGLLDELYGGGSIEFDDVVRAWRGEGAFAGLELS